MQKKILEYPRIFIAPGVPAKKKQQLEAAAKVSLYRRPLKKPPLHLALIYLSRSPYSATKPPWSTKRRMRATLSPITRTRILAMMVWHEMRFIH